MTRVSTKNSWSLCARDLDGRRCDNAVDADSGWYADAVVGAIEV